MLHRLSLALVLVFSLAAGAANAETITAQRDRFAASMEVPTGWTTRRMPTDPRGVVAAISPENGAVFLGVGPMDSGGTDRSVAQFIQGMGGTLQGASTPTAVAQRPARLYLARATLGGRPAQVRVVAVALSPAHILMVASVLFDNAPRAAHSRTLAIASSVRLVPASALAPAR